MLFESKPMVVEAMQFQGDAESAQAVANWIQKVPGHICDIRLPGPELAIHYKGQSMAVRAGDYVILDVHGKEYTVTARIKTEAGDRFWHKVNVAGPDDCWLWNRKDTRTATSPGQVFVGTVNGKRQFCPSNKFAWTTAGKPPVADGEFILNTCGNILCCNVKHMRPWSYRQAGSSGQDALALKYPDGRTFPLPICKLKESDIPVIRRLIAEGQTQRSIAERFGVHPTTINAVHKRRNWADVN